MTGAMVEQHQPLVRSIAQKILREFKIGWCTEVGDLVGFGNGGLLEAAKRFDPGRGVAFATFAYYRVRGAMIDGIRAMNWLSWADVERWRNGERCMKIVSLDTGNDLPPPEVEYICPEERVDRARLRRALRTAMDGLEDAERRLVVGYFFEGLTLDQIGAEIGKSKSWTCRLLERALGRLRERIPS